MVTELCMKGNSWFAAEILHCWGLCGLSRSVRGSDAPEHCLQLLLLQLLRSRHLLPWWPPLFGVPSCIPTPVHPSVLCLLEAKSSPSASSWQTAGALCSCPASSAPSTLSPFLLVPASPPPHPGVPRSQQCPAHHSPGLCGSASGLSPRDLSSPALGLCSSLIWPSHDLLQPYLAQPYLRTVGATRGDRSSNLWPCCPPGVWLRVNKPCRSLAQRINPVLGVAAAGGALLPHWERPQGASPAGEPRPGGISLGFFPPHSTAQDGEVNRGCC